MEISLGLGLTSNCDLRCPHCYRPPAGSFLSFEDVRRTCEALCPAGVNLGTGESALHPEFHDILGYLFDRGLPVSLVSNGLSVAALPDEMLRRLHDVEVSIDFAAERPFDAFRGDGAWARAMAALERCRRLGVRTGVLAVLMRANHRQLPRVARVAASLGAPLRVNVYQPVRSPVFMPTPAEFWWAIQDLADSTVWLGCSEPVVLAAAGLPGSGACCGRSSVRVTPAAEVLPCVYWPTPAGTVSDIVTLGERILEQTGFHGSHGVPDACRDCDLRPACGGGCSSRRMLVGGIDRPDPYCPKTGAVRLPLRPRLGERKQRLHLANLCTLLVQA